MLKNKWIDPNKKIAFAGISQIYDFYKKSKPIKEIQDELSNIPTYTRHKEGKKVKFYNPFYVYNKNEMWQVDLMYLPNLEKENKGYKYLLCLIDVFTRKLFIRKLKNKMSKTVLTEFSSIHNEIGVNPEKVVADKGSEFKCQPFKDYCEFHGINLIFTNNDTKAAVVERVQRTFQNILYRMMEEKQTKVCLPLLDQVLSIYNNRKHRSINNTPNFAWQEKNHSIISQITNDRYSLIEENRKNPKFSIGDKVRVKEKRNKFSRGYHPYFSEEVFKIHKVHTNLPQPMYTLTNYAGNEIIEGSFYENELALSNHDIFKIEKILKKRKKRGKIEFFVKWLGYPSSDNSWVESSWVVEKKK
jgi:hypothetical protein